MSVFSGKRILRWALLLTPWLLALLLAAGWGLSTWTPGYLETLIPRLAGEMGLPLEEFHIRGAGLFSADIGPVRLGPENGGLRINNVRVTYTPTSLRAKRVNTIELSGVSLDCRYENSVFSLPILDLLPASEKSTGNEIPKLPFDSLKISDSLLHASVEGTHLAIPFSAELSPGEKLAITADLHPRDQRISVVASLGPTMNALSLNVAADSFQIEALSDLLPIPIKGKAGLIIDAEADLDSLDTTDAKIELSIRHLALPGTGVEFGNELIGLQARLHDQAIQFSLPLLHVTAPWPATLAITEGNVSKDLLSAQFALETAGVTLPGSLRAECTDEQWNIVFMGANQDTITVDTGGRQLRLGGIDVNIAGRAAPDMADVILKVNSRHASLNGIPAQTGPIALTLPLAWPAPKRHTPGSLRISNLRYDTYNIGTMVTKVRQESMGVALDGLLYSQLLPDLQVKLSGAASMERNDATFTFDVPRYTLTDAFNPATLAPSIKGISILGNLSIEGGLDVVDGEMTSRMGAFLTNGTMTIKPKSDDTAVGTVIHGIRLYFESPDLINFRSAPAQLFSFEKITAGPVEVGNGVVTFQLEPRGVVLVERLGFDWVGGHVASRAFRIVPGHEEYEVTLFCSELRLTNLLKQLGLAEAKGDAALSGEMPVTWKRGKISFHNGFLHSTPGEGGTIQVDAMQDLVSAIPKGTPQRGQLELAREAIKDFEYKWVRIKADTVGEDLLVRLSVDGKPVSTLPFVYTKEFGGFARVTGDMKGSNFQGLRLDVNFSLPLDRILLYKDIINMIE